MSRGGQPHGTSITIPLRGTDKEVAQVGVMAMQALTLAAIAFAGIVAPERKGSDHRVSREDRSAINGPV